ncbi:CD15/CS22/SEF14 family fimbrial major subunit [Escherichia coli]
MRKFTTITLAALAAFSMTTASAVTLSGTPVNVDASVDVVAPEVLSATWTPVPALQAGVVPQDTKIGTISVTNLGSNHGWAIYAASGSNDAEVNNGATEYTFRNDDGSVLKGRVNPANYAGVSYGQGAIIGTGPVTFLPAAHTSVDLVTPTQQQVKAGTYTATLSISAYNN